MSTALERWNRLMWLTGWWSLYERVMLSEEAIEEWRVRSQARSNAARYLHRKQRWERQAISVIALVSVVIVAACYWASSTGWPG